MALTLACVFGEADRVRLFLQVLVNDVHDEDDLALRRASFYGRTECVRLLLDAGADVHAKNDDALGYASESGHAECVQLLLAAGADVHAKNDEALSLASKRGHTECVRRLIQAGADVSAGNYNAFRWASSNGHTECVRVLLQAGADVHAWNDYALRWASAYGHTECVRLLLDAGATITYRILCETSENGFIKCARILLGRMRRASVPDHLLPQWYTLQLPSVRRIIEFHRTRVSPRTHRPPTAPLPTHPTRDDLIACLATAGKSFAHAYWTEGLPLGPNPFL